MLEWIYLSREFTDLKNLPYLTLVLLNQVYPAFANSVDPD